MDGLDGMVITGWYHKVHIYFVKIFIECVQKYTKNMQNKEMYKIMQIISTLLYPVSLLSGC